MSSNNLLMSKDPALLFYFLFAFIKKFFLPLFHARYKVYTRTEQSLKGCVLATLGLVSILLAEGLSPGVTLFSPRKEYARMVALQKGNQVLFSNVLSLFLNSVTTTNARVGGFRQDDKLPYRRREIGYSEGG